MSGYIRFGLEGEYYVRIHQVWTGGRILGLAASGFDGGRTFDWSEYTRF